MEQKKRILLVESFPFTPNTKVLKESIENNNGRIVLSGKIQASGQRNGNGRIYPRAVLEDAVNRYKERILGGGGYSELDHCDKNIIEWKNVSHRMTDIWWEGDEVHGKLILYNTTLTEPIREAIATGGKIGISSRAEGSVTERGNTVIVDMGLELISFDLVTNPSTFGAYMSVQQEKSIYESYDPSNNNKYSNILSLTSNILNNS